MEREEAAARIEQRRHEIINRPPHEHPIFPELAAPVQAYLSEEYLATRETLPKDERKSHSAQAIKYVQQIVRDEELLGDVTRYGEAVSNELDMIARGRL